jgi:hypothetical protein
MDTFKFLQNRDFAKRGVFMKKSIFFGILALALIFGLALVGCGGDPGGDPPAAPDGSGGVTVASDGKLKIEADISAFDYANRAIVSGSSITGKTVNAYISADDEGNTRYTLGTGSITNGKLSITVDKPRDEFLKQAQYSVGTMSSKIETGADVLIGDISIRIENGGWMELWVNPTVVLETEDSDNDIDGPSVAYLYSKGDDKINGSVMGTNTDGNSVTQTGNVTLQEGWNIIVQSEVKTESGWAVTIESKSPGSDAKWIYFSGGGGGSY